MFFLCFFVWAVVVDHVILPSGNALTQEAGQFTRYRVKKRKPVQRVGLLKDEVLIYALVEGRERLYYMDYKPQFELTLKNVQTGTPLQLRYDNRFPKFWKKKIYDLRSSGLSILSYSPGQLIHQQRGIWKFTGIMGGVFLFLLVIRLIRKPRRY